MTKNRTISVPESMDADVQKNQEFGWSHCAKVGYMHLTQAKSSQANFHARMTKTLQEHEDSISKFYLMVQKLNFRLEDAEKKLSQTIERVNGLFK